MDNLQTRHRPIINTVYSTVLYANIEHHGTMLQESLANAKVSARQPWYTGQLILSKIIKIVATSCHMCLLYIQWITSVRALIRQFTVIIIAQTDRQTDRQQLTTSDPSQLAVFMAARQLQLLQCYRHNNHGDRKEPDPKFLNPATTNGLVPSNFCQRT